MNEEKQDVAYVKFGPFYSQFAQCKENKANKQEDTVNRKKWLNSIVNILNPVNVDRDTAALIVYSATIAAWAVLAARPQSFSQLLVLAFGAFVVSALIGAFILAWHYSKIDTYIEYSGSTLNGPKSADEVTTAEAPTS